MKIKLTFMNYAQSLPYKDRLNYLRDTKILPESAVRVYQQALRKHALNPDTKAQTGTFGANRHKNPPFHGTHFYNPKTKRNIFFNSNYRLRSGWKLNKKQQQDLLLNQNIT